MQASSTYPKLAGISSKTATEVRQQLVSKGFIKEHTVDTGGRGRSSILLEVLPEGIKAITEYQESQI
jgi:DNA-binding MarR family transcriptional regulator